MDRDTSAGMAAVGQLVAGRPDEFAGSYVDDSGVVVVVLAGGRPFRAVRGTASAAELARVHTRLRDFDWPSGRPAYGSFVDPARCAVVLQVKSLPAADKQALARRFGRFVAQQLTVEVVRRRAADLDATHVRGRAGGPHVHRRAGVAARARWGSASTFSRSTIQRSLFLINCCANYLFDINHIRAGEETRHARERSGGTRRSAHATGIRLRRVTRRSASGWPAGCRTPRRSAHC